MIKAEITTPWTGTGTMKDPNRPLLPDIFTIKSWTDTTGQPAENLQPDPNIFIIEVVCEQAVLNAIELDDRFAVLWDEEIIEEMM